MGLVATDGSASESWSERTPREVRGLAVSVRSPQVGVEQGRAVVSVDLLEELEVKLEADVRVER